MGLSRGKRACKGLEGDQEEFKRIRKLRNNF